MRYLSIVNVLPAVDGGQCPQFGVADTITGTEAKQ